MKKLNRIKEVLKEQGRSQTFLSEKLDKSKNAINAICNNTAQPSLDTIYQIADILGVEVSSLLEGNVTMVLDTTNDGTATTAPLGRTTYLVERFDSKDVPIASRLFSSLDKMTAYCKQANLPLSQEQIQVLKTALFVRATNTVYETCKITCITLE